MIKLKDINKVYQTKTIETLALNNINMDIRKGEFVSVMGPSGCGKSTMLNIMGLIDEPSSGTIEVAGQNITNYNSKSIAKFRNEHLGFIFQSFHLIPDLSIIDNVELPLIYRNFPEIPVKSPITLFIDNCATSSAKSPLSIFVLEGAGSESLAGSIESINSVAFSRVSKTTGISIEVDASLNLPVETGCPSTISQPSKVAPFESGSRPKISNLKFLIGGPSSLEQDTINTPKNIISGNRILFVIIYFLKLYKVTYCY